MSYFVIEGGYPLKGEITPAGNKNEALPAIAASILTDQNLILKNVPKIGDVLILCEILKKLGAHIDWKNETILEINTSKLNNYTPDQILCEKLRASILLLGPILVRLGKIKLPFPGGDVIGIRRIDTHWEGLLNLGAKLQITNMIEGTLKKPIGNQIFLDEPSVTGTENIILASVLAEGTTTIYNAACEPHVRGLCRLLNQMGAKISGIGSNMLIIEGVHKLNGTEYEISPDFMEIGSFLCLGALNNNEIIIKNINYEDFNFILKTLSKIGINPKYNNNSFIIKGTQTLKIKQDIGAKTPVIYSGPWPAFPTDLMSVSIVSATQSQGTIIFFEKMFEGRMFFTDKLIQMGATIILCDPHRVVVSGPSQLKGYMLSSPDVRAGMALLIASLIAKGKSEIHNIYQIERGYSQIYQKLEQIGAKIKKII